MRKYKVAIMGTRGIPNRYGGFEELAENLAAFLVNRGCDVSVYQSHNHPYLKNDFNGAQIIRCYNPEVWMGTFGQFFYDLNCILHARKKHFDVCLHLGYTSNTIWYMLWPSGSRHISNMDGLEWKRSKYSKPVQRFLRQAEKIAVRKSDICVADHPEMAVYLKRKYGVESPVISYGASATEVAESLPDSVKHLKAFDLVIARMEPENHVHFMLEAHEKSKVDRPLVILGNISNVYARNLKNAYPGNEKRYWMGGVYDKPLVERLRRNCTYYYHGHSVGGTNPSLVQAMASGCRILAHDNIFNRGVLANKAKGYFSSAADLTELIQQSPGQQVDFTGQFSDWDSICRQYEELILETLQHE
jgi:glycosyltransferase involved in cell wall biosynthesis